MTVRIGSRGSKLAMWQARHVQQMLQQRGIDSQITEIRTRGDIIQDRPLQEIGMIGIFTKALDEALLRGEIDLAVHSAKDLPSDLPQGLCLGAALKREDPRDVLLALTEELDLDNFSRSLKIGTSSARRRALLQHYFQQVKVADIRGNVDTRLKKLIAGEYDGLILAYAGVKRLGLESYIVRKLNPQTFTPAVGQGVVAVVCTEDFFQQSPCCTYLNHEPSLSALVGERAFLKEMQGGCSTPTFGLATVIGKSFSLTAGMALEEGKSICRQRLDGETKHAVDIGQQLARSILKEIYKSDGA